MNWNLKAMNQERKRLLGIMLLALASGILSFQNCGKVAFKADAPSDNEFYSTSGIVINDGALFTNDMAVKLKIRSPQAAEMFITNDPLCEKDGQWESIKESKPWTLAKPNSLDQVYGKFRTANGVDLPCINASITHDNIAPTVDIKSGPAPFVNVSTADFVVQGDDGGGSGIDRYECRVGGGDFKACPPPVAIADLPEGRQQFQVRAIDRAGNRSQVEEHAWTIDKTPPTIKFVEVPTDPLKDDATLRFEAEDVGGTGVKEYFCQLDTSAVKSCTSPDLHTNLSQGQHRFTVFAVDYAGNPSAPITHTWDIDNVPPAAFDVIGVTGGQDLDKDGLLGTVLNPTVHWFASSGAVKYTVAIIDDTSNTVVCPAQDSMTTSYAYSAGDCTLVDGESYRARVVAFDTIGNSVQAPLYKFKVDASGPKITITGPFSSDDQKTATVKFSITDPSGVKDALCYKKFGASEQAFPCKDLSSMEFLNLQEGEHSFRISAIDKAGNTSNSDVVTWKVKLVICDPFNNVTGGCKKGLRADLFYLTGSQIQSPYNDVNSYIQYGKQANALIYMSQLFVPTRVFTSGFSTGDSTLVRDDNGQVLYEWFALRLDTLIKLGPNDAPGKYQFALLSDDGSIMEITPTGATSPEILIDNDKQHSTRLGCDLKGLSLTSTTKLKTRIKYFQGPRTHIAVSLLWRPMPTDNAQVTDPLCGKASNDSWFGSNLSQPDYVNHDYGQLVQRGWKPLAPENFITEEEDKSGLGAGSN